MRLCHLIVALPGPFIKRGLFVGSPLLFGAWERLCHLIVALRWPFIGRGLFVGVSSGFGCMGEVVSFDCGAQLAFHRKGSLRRGLLCFLVHGRGCVI